MADEEMNQLQMIEQNLQALLMQKQQFQAQLLEVESADKELTDASVSYKIVGNIMVRKDKDSLKSELLEKKEMLEVRLKTIDKQETRLREKAQALQKDVLSRMNENVPKEKH